MEPLMSNKFPKQQSGAPLHTLSKSYDVPISLDPSASFEVVYSFIYGRRRVVVARYRTICLFLVYDLTDNDTF